MGRIVSLVMDIRKVVIRTLKAGIVWVLDYLIDWAFWIDGVTPEEQEWVKAVVAAEVAEEQKASLPQP